MKWINRLKHLFYNKKDLTPYLEVMKNKSIYSDTNMNAIPFTTEKTMKFKVKNEINQNE